MATSRSLVPVLRSSARLVLCLGLALGALTSTTLVSVDAAADTFRPEFVVGTVLTAKKDHSLVPRGTAIKAGTKGKVTKVHSSGGKIVALDVAVGSATASKVPVTKIRELYDYLKL